LLFSFFPPSFASWILSDILGAVNLKGEVPEKLILFIKDRNVSMTSFVQEEKAPI